jgi:hypothetical protein
MYPAAFFPLAAPQVPAYSIAMKRLPRHHIIGAGMTFLITIIFFLCPITSRAAVADSSSDTNDISEIDLNADISHLSPTDALQLAYNILFLANHDYLGHRAGAMSDISQAAAAFNITLDGDGHGHEPQDVSDAQFVFARRLLLHARSRISTTPESQPVLDHIESALVHLIKGLKIRAVQEDLDPCAISDATPPHH